MPIGRLPHGLVVRISGFHPGGPGSIPGAGNEERSCTHTKQIGQWTVKTISSMVSAE